MKTTFNYQGINTVLTSSFIGTSSNVWEGDKLPRNQFRITISNANGRGWFKYTDSYNNYSKGITELDESGVKNALYCFLSDGSCYSSCFDFADFCANFGYDEDSRKAWKAWKACKRSHEKAAQLFGNDYANEMDTLED